MTLPYYHGLLLDARRIEGFQQAIAETVQEGDVVLEIGTGLGTYAFFAADSGAARVHAVDGLPIVHVAESVGDHNGYGDRIRWHRGWVPEVELDEAADVLVFEDFSTRLLDTETYRMLAAAYQKYLRPGGRVLPGRARLMLAPVSGDAVWKNQLPMPRTSSTAFGIDWSPSLEYAENTPTALYLPADRLAAKPVELAAFELFPLPRASGMGGSARWQLEPGTTVHGLAYWFEFELAPGTWVRNAPGPECGAWGQLFLAASTPVVVPEDGAIEAAVHPHEFDDGAPGWLSWELRWTEGLLQGNEFGADPASLEDLVGDPTPLSLIEKARAEKLNQDPTPVSAET